MTIPFPLVTIITPTYNQGQFIEATIKSVLGQTYKNIEYIVIDAMSADNTEKVLEKYQNKINKIIREPDQGQSDAIVKGFKMAQGDLVGWINSDDTLYPDCVEKIVAAYQKSPQAVLFYNSKIDIVSESGVFQRVVDVPVYDRNRLLRHSNTLVQPGSFYSNKALAKVGYFNKNLKFSMDLDLWLRLLNVGESVNISSEPIAAYREWGGTKTATGDAKLLKERKLMLASHGAKATDRTMRAIYLGLIKSCVRNLPYMGRALKRLKELLY